MTQVEIETMVGVDVASSVRIVNHNWSNPDALIDLGVTPSGTLFRSIVSSARLT